MPLFIDNRQKKIKLNGRKMRSDLTRVLKHTDCYRKEISLSLVDDAEITVINHEYLGRDRATNVISFGMREGEWSQIQPDLLGDIMISVETAERDALAGEIDLHDEILFLFIHGLLHLLGYDHENGIKEDAEQMKAKEKEIFFAVKHYEIDHD